MSARSVQVGRLSYEPVPAAGFGYDRCHPPLADVIALLLTVDRDRAWSAYIEEHARIGYEHGLAGLTRLATHDALPAEASNVIYLASRRETA